MSAPGDTAAAPAAGQAAAPARRRWWARGGRLVGAGLRGAPATVGLVVALLVVAVATGSLVDGPSRGLLRHVAVGVRPLSEGRWWTPLSSLLWARGIGGYLLAVLVLLVLAAPAERRLGWRRFLVAGLAGQVVGTLAAVGLVRLVALAPGDWARQLERAVLVGPTPFAVGALLAASSQLDTLWRRRLRVGALTTLLVLALYGGFLHDLTALLGALVGLALGPVLAGRRARVTRVTGTRREGRVLVSLAVAASALGPVLAAFSPQAVGPLSTLAAVFTSAPPDATAVLEVCADPGRAAECAELQAQVRLSGAGPVILSLLPSLVLLVLSDGLRRGRRFAWVGAVVLSALLAVLAAVLGAQALLAGDPVGVLGRGGSDVPLLRDLAVPVLGPVAVLVLLLTTRRFFDVAAPRGTYRSFAVLTGALLVGLAVLYVGVGTLVSSGFDRPPGAIDLLLDLPRRLVPPGYLVETAPGFLPRSLPATLLFEWTGVVFWAALAGQALLTFLRSPEDDAGTDRARARELLRRHGGSDLSWMTTWRGNRYWFTPSGEGFVAYRVHAGVAISTGDPVGPTDELDAAVAGFARFATDLGWTVCLYSVTERVRRACAELGWSHLQVAEETVLPLGSLAFTGKKFQDVRTALNRAGKQGITAEWLTYPSAPLALTDQITAISEEWVADKGLPEMGFTLGGLDEVDDPEVRCLVAVDADRTVHGVTSWLPVHRDGRVVGWTLDFMRRRTDGFRPSMEFLIASAALLLQEEGAERLSLSGAPLARVPRPGEQDPDEDAPAVLVRLLDVLGRALEPVYGFRSLLAFKAKFQPEYEPIFLTYADPAALPAIGNAIGRAYLPEVSLGQGVALVRKLAARS